jgi:Transposase, Mutator family
MLAATILVKGTAGVSVRRVEDITEALWGTPISPSTVSKLNQKIYAQIETWRNRPIDGEHVYVYLDGIWLKRSWGGENATVYPPGPLQRRGVARNNNAAPVGVQRLVRPNSFTPTANFTSRAHPRPP